jgi:hypothetical protein
MNVLLRHLKALDRELDQRSYLPLTDIPMLAHHGGMFFSNSAAPAGTHL